MEKITYAISSKTHQGTSKLKEYWEVILYSGYIGIGLGIATIIGYTWEGPK